MNTKDITEAKDEYLRNSLRFLKEASQQARKIAIQTGTNLVIVKDGKLTHVSAEELVKKEPISPST